MSAVQNPFLPIQCCLILTRLYKHFDTVEKIKTESANKQIENHFRVTSFIKNSITFAFIYDFYFDKLIIVPHTCDTKLIRLSSRYQNCKPAKSVTPLVVMCRHLITCWSSVTNGAGGTFSEMTWYVGAHDIRQCTKNNWQGNISISCIGWL